MTGPTKTRSTGPLAGIRILEIGHMLAGPYATMMLADLGAEVIKIEPPDGDISGRVGVLLRQPQPRQAPLCVDLTSETGQLELGELISGSHALLANLKPSAIHRYGLTYETLRRWNERIVCVALTGFGLEAGDDPAFDYVIQATTGVAALTGDPLGPPTLPGYSAADNPPDLLLPLDCWPRSCPAAGGRSRYHCVM